MRRELLLSSFGKFSSLLEVDDSVGMFNGGEA